MRPSRPVVLVAAAASSLALALPAAAAPPGTAPPAAAAAGGLPARAVSQLEALGAAKRARSTVQRKVDSRLLAEARQRAGGAVAAGVGRVSTGVVVDKAGRTPVQVHAPDGKAASALAGRIRAVGGLVHSAPVGDAVRADVPVAAAEKLAAAPEVSRVNVVPQAVTAHEGPAVPVPAKTSRDAVLRRRLADALGRVQARSTTGAVTPRIGAVTSEGDRAHAADTARATRRVTGTGVTVGILSDGVDSLAASIASGDLPADTRVLPGQAGSGDEGTAMLEIVHDLAPAAKLVFATAFTDEPTFAQNIRDLRAAGAGVIADDVLYYDESPFQDGPVAQSVAAVTAAGALYFSSAGNEGNVDAGTSGNWEGDFVSSGQGVGKQAGDAHDFAPGSAVQVLDPLTPGSGGVVSTLHWADPLGHATDDYDLYVLDPAGNVVAFSNNVQDGTQDPFEILQVPANGLADRIAVLKFSGQGRYFQVSALRGRFATDGPLTAYATAGVTRGHSAVPAAFSVAAAPAAAPLPFDLEPGDPPNPSGPYPGVFTGRQQPERFTSDGPRRVFFAPDGTPLTPGDTSSTGGQVRLKPDVTAADGTSTTVPGFQPFFGTSAAAPHAAAIAALALSGNPGITPGEVREAFSRTAVDLLAPGYDRDTGYGVLRADKVLTYTGATPQPLVAPGTPTVANSTDGDAYLEPGESAVLTVPVTNTGDADAPGVSVQVTTSTPGVTITPTVRSYGRVARGGTVRRTFRIALAASFEPGVPVDLRVKASFLGAYSPQTTTVALPTGQPSDTVVDVAYTGPAVPIPDADPAGASVPLTVSGVGRLSRLTFSVDGTACSTDPGATTVGIDHTYVRDLVGSLTAPDGRKVTLFAQVGGGGNNICRAVFDDAATRSITTATADDAPFTGSWAPAEPLSTLVGGQADGTWTFTAVDTAGADTGSLRAVSLHVSGYVHPAG